MRSPIALAAALAVLAPSVTTAPAFAQAADPATTAVQSLDAGLLAIMHAGKRAGFQARAAQIGPVVDRSFDLPLMTRLAIGPGWTSIAPSDQAGLVAGFRRLTVNAYARNFDGFSGQSFTIAPQVDGRGGDRLVRTTLNDPLGDPVAISYRLREGAGGWRIIDVFYRNAISQLATRRSDFAQILQQGGAKALVAHLDAMAVKGAG